ncbi:hypothetical protein IEO21_10220 [Rhodonia placenta]|uniref:Secreted protein n=1 Tax=Rhodonia placenta TaxID=104341 RepID=A0A8H7TXR4_9APHY|nr:hypothetical protein IEO21_10220 [Postia placenta]
MTALHPSTALFISFLHLPLPAARSHARTLPPPRHGAQPRRVPNAPARLSSRNTRTRATRISAGAPTWASHVLPRRLPPLDQTCIPVRRARQRQDARVRRPYPRPVASCRMFCTPAAGSRPPGNPPAGQHAGRRRSREILHAQSETRASANGTSCPRAPGLLPEAFARCQDGRRVGRGRHGDV